MGGQVRTDFTYKGTTVITISRYISLLNQGRVFFSIFIASAYIICAHLHRTYCDSEFQRIKFKKCLKTHPGKSPVV